MRIALFVLLFLVSALAINTLPKALRTTRTTHAPAPAPIKAARLSIVGILSNNHQICTGFIAQGKVITAGHCVDDGASLAASLYDGRIVPLRVEAHIKDWPKNDYAILAADGLPRGLTIGNTPDEGDDVWAWMMPLGWKKPVLSKGSFCGTISGYEGLDGMLYTSINGAPGASGSPILNEQGEVVAILVGGFDVDAALTGTIVVRPPKLS